MKKTPYTFLLAACTFSFIAACLLFPHDCPAQNVGININGTMPDASAGLDIDFADKGLLIPRLTSAQRMAIPAPATGLLVYDSDFNQFWYFNGALWVPLQNGIQGPTGLQGVTGPSGMDGAPGPTGMQGVTGVTGPTGTASDAWMLPGNAGTIPGTAPGENFLGTTDAQDMIIATNSTERFLLSSNGDILMTGDFLNQEISSQFQTNLFQITATSSATAQMVDSASIVIGDGPGSSGSGVMIIASVRGRGLSFPSNGVAGCYNGWTLMTMLLERSVNDPNFTAPVTLSTAWTTTCMAYGVNNGLCNILALYYTLPIVFYDDIAGVVSGDRVYYRISCYNSFNGVLQTGNNSVSYRSLVVVQIKR